MVGRHVDAVGLGHVRQDELDGPVGIDPVDAEDRLLDWFMAEISRICEVDMALPIDDQIIGSIEGAAITEASKDMAAAAGQIRTDDGAATEIGAAGDDHTAVGIEFDPGGHPTGGSDKARSRSWRGLKAQMFPAAMPDRNVGVMSQK